MFLNGGIRHQLAQRGRRADVDRFAFGPDAFQVTDILQAHHAFGRGDLLCLFSAGAYGMVMASQYNATPRPAEVLVDGSAATIIRRRETYEDLVAAEAETTAI